MEITELRRRLEGLNVYLVGMMGAGKSAVGGGLARLLGYRCLDADSMIATAAGCSVAEIFQRHGEAGFRELESQVLGQIAAWHSSVVCTGGGAVTRPSNWGVMRQGVVVWLDAPAALLLSRLQADATPRPLLDGDDPGTRLAALLEERLPLYSQADLRIPQQAGMTPLDVVTAILAALPTLLKERATAPEQPARLQDAAGHGRSGFN